MALLLTSIRRIHKAYNRTRDFNFSLAGLTGFELSGKTVGVIGTGRIGRAFIDICRGFHMRVLCYDKYPIDDPSLTYVPMEELLRESDVISFHCPLTDETRHLINESTLPLLKKGVVLVNTSRGALIDSEALLSGIKQRIIGAACLDVYEEESKYFFNDWSANVIRDDILARLLTFPNVIVTSHQAFLTTNALENIADITLNNIKDFSEENELKNGVFI
jgi:D-lactate dehydrogenase